MTEFTFDIKLWTTARVLATNEIEARRKLAEATACVDINYNQGDVLIVDAHSEGEHDLIEIDGVEIN